MLAAERVLELHMKGLSGFVAELVRAAIILAVGVLASRILDRQGQRGPGRASGMDAHQYTMFRYLARFVLYLMVVLALLAAFGVGLSSVVFGGAFLTVIVGLAGQTVFGNLLAGLALVLFHPFSIGDRVSLMTWQYPLLMPSFPHEPLMPAYVGTVTDVNLLYSYLELENGLPMAIPNGIVLQAAVLNHALSGHRVVRLRFDVDLALDPSLTSERVQGALEDMPGLAPGRRPEVQVADLSPTTFALVLRLPVTPIVSDDAVRHHALTRAAQAVRAATHEEATAGARMG